VEGYIWQCRGSNGKIRYEYRRQLRNLEKLDREYKDIRKRLGPNLERAMAKAKIYDAECEAISRGETPMLKLTLGEYAEQYVAYIRDEAHHLGWKTVRGSIRAFVQHIGSQVPLHDVKRPQVEDFLESRRRKFRPVTIKGNLRDVRRMFNVGIQKGHLDLNPTMGIRVDKGSTEEPRIPTNEELKRLMEYLQVRRPWLNEIATILLYTGARLSEALGMEWVRVDFTTEKLTLNRRKVRDTLTLDMARPLAEMLNAKWMNSGMPKEGKVFANSKGLEHLRGVVYVSFKKVARELGMSWLTLKTFRKLAATWVQQSTGDIRAAQKLLGHTSIRTTELYLGCGSEAKAIAVKALEERVGLAIGDGKVGNKVGNSQNIEV
jgi:integrase